jgi:CheY-like chemotaxis protein
VEMLAKRVLCVDDDAAILLFRQHLLEEAGYYVVTAASGVEALQILSGGAEIDVVLLDYLMPGMNGDELAGQLREKHPHLRLIAVSAVRDLPPNFLRVIDEHVLKGQDPDVLLSSVSAVLARPLRENRNERLSLPKTVLCVEDEQLQLQLRKMLLESAGFVVLQAQSAAQALQVFKSTHVDAVIMDYWLPGTNGTAVAEEMKRLRPKIPIVMFSGFASLPGEGALVDAWLRKADVEPEHLVNEIKRLIGLRSRSGQAASS